MKSTPKSPIEALNLIPAGAEFFAGDTLEVARELVGAWLKVGGRLARIVETEAYKLDAASHAIIRRRKAAAMRETFGHVYVYRIYGVHFCLNFTTEREGVGAVLIRAAEPKQGLGYMAKKRGRPSSQNLASGPGNLCRAFGIDLRDDGKPVGERIEVFSRSDVPRVGQTRRVGITRAVELEWRFFDLDSPCVSLPRPPPGVRPEPPTPFPAGEGKE